MQSSNPVFRKAEGFNGRGAADPYGNRTYAGNGVSYPRYGSSRRASRTARRPPSRATRPVPRGTSTRTHRHPPPPHG